MIAMTFTIELDIGISFLPQAALPQLVIDRETKLIVVGGPSDRTAIADAARRSRKRNRAARAACWPRVGTCMTPGVPLDPPDVRVLDWPAMRVGTSAPSSSSNGQVGGQAREALLAKAAGRLRDRSCAGRVRLRRPWDRTPRPYERKPVWACTSEPSTSDSRWRRSVRCDHCRLWTTVQATHRGHRHLPAADRPSNRRLASVLREVV
jgi:hypothetical protein